MVDVRKDLEKLRLATGLVQRRERDKKSQATIVYDLLTDFLFPHESTMRDALSKFIRCLFVELLSTLAHAPL